MSTLPALSAKKASSKSWIWGLCISVAILLTAAVVWWQIYRLKKKINKLQTDKLILEDQIKELRSRIELSNNQEEAAVLQSAIEALQKAIQLKETELEELREQAQSKQDELDNAKPW